MIKTTLLRSLDKPGNGIDGYIGGTFFLFSQYANDMSSYIAMSDAYKVVPSSFAAFNIDYSNETSESIGELFQNTLEHSAAYHRNSHDPNSKLTPRGFSSLFWQTMKELLPNSNENNENNLFSDKLVHIGTTDISGVTTINGENYSDIYCYIDSSIPQRKYYKSSIAIPEQEAFTVTETPTFCHGWSNTTYPSITNDQDITYPNGISPEGGVNTLSITNVDCPINMECNNNSSVADLMNSYSQAIDNNIINTSYDEVIGNSFNINTIVVFYDIVAKDINGNYNYIYTNIPLGIYFTGPIKDGVMENSICKYVTHNDIFNQGTAYGLRISTKYSSNPSIYGDFNGDMTVNVVLDGSSSVNAAAIISSMSDTAQSIIDNIANQNNIYNEIKDHLAEFRNKNTNIPYIKSINGIDYWFVNGRNTGRKVYGALINNDQVTIEDLISSITGAVLDNLSNNPSLLETLEDVIREEINNSITNLGDIMSSFGNYIEYIANKYPDDTVSSIPNNKDFQDILNAKYMFKGFSNLKYIPRLEMSNCNNMEEMFAGCKKIENIYLPDTHNVTNMDNSFNGCESLKTLVIDASSCKSFNNTFKGCTSLENLSINNLRGSIGGYTIDLSDTKVSINSIIKIIRGVQYENIVDIVDNNISNSYKLTIKVPQNINMSIGAINDAIYDAENNKGVYIILNHQQ